MLAMRTSSGSGGAVAHTARERRMRRIRRATIACSSRSLSERRSCSPRWSSTAGSALRRIDPASASAAAIAAARLVAEDPNPVPVAVLPGLWLGLSEHHLPFGGTISVDYAAYRAILESIVRSLRALGFARLLIVNGHGGNIDPLAVASRELAVAYDFPIVATTPWFLAPGRLTDRVWAYARNAGIPMAPPLGAHRLVAATVLERFDQAVADRMVA